MTAFLDGITRNGDAARAAETDRMAATSRLAATLISKQTNRHHCRGEGCRHRNCRRDTLHRGLLLEALGLPEDWASPADYETPLDWGSVTRGEISM